MVKFLKKTIFIRVLFYIAFIAFIMLRPIGEAGRSTCLFYLTTGLLCPGCGSTRAAMHFFHFEFFNALNFNPFFTCVIAPLFLFCVFQELWIFIARVFLKRDRLSFVEFYISLIFGALS